MTTRTALDPGRVGIRAPGLRTRRRRLALLALLFLFTLALAWVHRDAIQTVNHESSDFAANTLLVLDAKRFHLVQGHYSRVGFNHPGPALLYVLAFGELLFHDLRHLVPSPFSGQLLAVDLYDAAWLTAIVAMVRRIAGSLLPALLFAAVTVLALAYCDRAILGGAWFPQLFALPYAALLVALARLVQGRTDTLVPLVLAAGFLVNGHAAFMPMLGLLLVLAVGANAVLTRREPERRIASRAWLTAQRRALLAAAGILALFLVPLVIATIRDFPGPLHDYLRFGRAHQTNTLADAAGFVGMYWGLGHGAPARGALAWGLLLLAVLGYGMRRLPAGLARDARALGIVFVAATASVLYYARVGVDMLDQVYLAVFYFAVPALAAGLLALIGYQHVRIGATLTGRSASSASDAAAGALALLALAGAWYWLRVPPDYVYFYNHANVAGLYQQVRKLPGTGRVVLDLDQDPATWGDVWGNTLGLLAYAKRQGVELACVNAHWHISFTKPLRCRPEEVAGGRRYTVRFSDAPDPVRGEPDAEGQGLALYRRGAPPRPLAYVTVGERPAYFRQILGKGWSVVEGDFVWSDGPLAELDLPADPRRGRRLTLDLGSFVPDHKAQMRAEAVLDGAVAGCWVFNLAERRRRIVLDLGAAAGAARHIVLRIDQPLRPVDYGMGQDARRLGVALYGIRQVLAR